jgi:hypothetical protein
MPAVALEDSEWNTVLGILATAPWRDANPLMMKIGGQLRTQQEFSKHGPPPPTQPAGNGQEEVRHE